jgi:ankyrin repeat protein
MFSHPIEIYKNAKKHYEEGNYSSAIILFKKCLGIYVSNNQDQSDQAATCYYALGLACQKASCSGEALQYFNCSAKIYAKLFGDEHLKTSGAKKKIIQLLSLEEQSYSVDQLDDRCNLVRKFFNAIDTGDYNTVKNCIHEGVSVTSSVGSVGFTDYRTQTRNFSDPLFGFFSSQKKISPLLVGMSKDTKFGESPLYTAARKGHVEIATLLIEHGAQLNHEESQGLTPLHVAVQEEQESMVERLLSLGATVDAETFDGSTPLFFSLERNNKNITHLLLQADANPNHVDKDGEFPLYVASLRGFADRVKELLVAGAKVNLAKPNGVTALFVAAQSGHNTTMELLFERGADVESQRSTDRMSPLQVAACTGHLAAVQLLIKHKADFTHRCKDNRTAFNYAQINHHKSIEEYLKRVADELSHNDVQQFSALELERGGHQRASRRP